MIKYIEALLISTMAIFAPIKTTLMTAMVLIAFDLVTGVWSAIKRKEKITSSGIRRTIVKLIVYEMSLAMGFLAETYLLDHQLPLVKLIAGLIALTETKSVFENMNIILDANIYDQLIKLLGSESTKDL